MTESYETKRKNTKKRGKNYFRARGVVAMCWTQKLFPTTPEKGGVALWGPRATLFLSLFDVMEWLHNIIYSPANR